MDVELNVQMRTKIGRGPARQSAPAGRSAGYPLWSEDGALYPLLCLRCDC